MTDESRNVPRWAASDLRQWGVGRTSWRSEGRRQRESVKGHVLAGELEGNYIISIPWGSGVGSKLADFCNMVSAGLRQYVLVRGSSEAWCRRSEPSAPALIQLCRCPLRSMRGKLQRTLSMRRSSS